MPESIRKDRQFFDRHWGLASKWNPEDLDRLSRTIACIPPQANSLLDVGCGDGLMAMAAKGILDGFVAGIDLSAVGLSRLTLPKCCGSAHQLPFGDRAFNIVLAAETLEHIPESIYAEARKEIARVAGQFILVTVPHSENLAHHEAICGSCHTRFHIWGHVRSFTPRRVHTLFPGFVPVTVLSIGEMIPKYNRLALWIRQNIAQAWEWEEEKGCFHCGSSAAPRTKWPLLARVCDSVNARIWGRVCRRPSWLLVLYSRQDFQHGRS